MLVAGLDIGSAFSRAVIMNNGRVVATSRRPTGGAFPKAIDGVLSDVFRSTNLNRAEIDVVGACGLGASFITQPFMKLAELSCMSRGIHFLLPRIRNIIEVGNQYSRVVKINDRGKVINSLVSDKCAAGSGRILQIVARVLGVDFDELGSLSAQANRPAQFTTNCAVFLETEAISRVAEGIPVADIIEGLHATMAAKIVTMAKRLKIEDDCSMTGGGAMDDGLARMIQEKLGFKLTVPKQSLFTGAIGAAMIANEKVADAVAAANCHDSYMDKPIGRAYN